MRPSAVWSAGDRLGYHERLDAVPMRAVATLCLLGLAGCSFDLGGFRAGAGGA